MRQETRTKPNYVSQDFLFLIFLALVALSGFFIYQSIHPEYIQYKLAHQDIRAGRKPANLYILVKELQHQPELLQRLADKLIEAKEDAAAIPLLKVVYLASAKPDPTTARQLASLLWAEGNILDALAVIQPIVIASPTDKLDRGTAAMYCQLLFASERYQEAYQLAVTFPETQFKLIAVEALIQRERYQPAMVVLSNLLTENPDDASVRIVYARALIKKAKSEIKETPTILAASVR